MFAPILLTLLSLSNPAVSFIQQDSILIQPKWKTGEKAEYTWFKARHRTVAGNRTTLGSSTTPLQLDVLLANTKGFELGWTFGESSIEQPGKASPSNPSPLLDPFKNYQVVIILDEDGDYSRMKNWTEIKKRGEKLIEEYETLLSKSSDRQAGKAGVQAVKNLFSSAAQFEAIGTKDYKLFLMINGLTLGKDDPMEYKDMLPNPLGGPYFPSDARFSLKSVSDDKKTATIVWTQRLNEKTAPQIITKTIEAMAKKSGKTIPESQLASIKAFDMKDDAEMIVDLNTGWLNSLRYTRIIKIGDVVQEEQTIVTRKK